MEVIVGNQSVPVREGPDGRLQATFRATEDTNRVIIPSDCIGTLHVNDIQLEEGLRATPYTEPKVYENDISGIFKDLRDLNLKIDDTENGLQTQIKINQSGLEQQIEDTQKGLASRLIATADIWQSQLKDTEQNLRSAMQQTSDSLITLIEDTDEENFSQTVQLVSGLQSTVEGQLRSQQTQLEGLIASTVKSATGADSLIWQTLESHGAQITNAQGDINSVEQRANSAHSRISDVEGNQIQITQTVDALDSRISNVNGDVSRLTQTVNGLSYDVHNANGTLKTEIRNLAGQIESKVSRGELDSIIRSSGDSIWFAVGNRVENVAQNSKMNGEDIVSEINISPSGVRIAGDNLHVSAQTVIDNGVITNNMLANNISANKITSGELNANQVRIVNLDVNSLTGNTTRFVQTNWNNAVGGNVHIDGSGIISNAPNSSQTYIQNGVVGTRNPNGASIGYIGYEDDGGSPVYTVRQTLGSHFKVKANMSGGSRDVFSLMSAGTEAYINTNNFYVQSSSTIFSGDVRLNFDRELRMNDGNIVNPYGIYLNHGGSLYSVSSNSQLRLETANNSNLSIRSNGSEALRIDGSYMYSMRNLSMEGNRITNQSDRRLKRDVEPTKLRSLQAIRRWKIVDFNWLDSDLNRQQGRQIGVIAQDTPEISVYDDKQDTWAVDSYKQTVMNTHAIQELDQITQVIGQKVKSNSERLHELEHELSNARDRISELEAQLA